MLSMRPAEAPPRMADGRLRDHGPAQHWNECRNALAIARLLSQERRPAPLVTTACRMAVDCACRAAMQQAGLPWDGDAARALRRLTAPEDVARPAAEGGSLAAAERAIDWTAAYLRRADPARRWSY